MTIQKWAKHLVLTAAALAASTSAFAQYSKVVVFGDSMSDTHRYHDFMKFTTGRDYPSPPSMPGRFSNGPVAVEVLAENLNAQIQVYAFSGAQSGYGTLLFLPLGVLTQVNEYLNNNAVVPTIETVPLVSSITSLLPGTGRADPKALHLIWTGPDDYYGIGGYNALTAYSITANIQQAITSLYDAGARYFFVPAMPDLASTPSARYNHEPKQPGYMATAAKYSAQFSVVLAKGLDAMRLKYPKARIMSFDTLGFMKTEMDKARAQGKNLTEACYPGGLLPSSGPRPLCPDPENYMFWDDNHPTALANKILGDGWAKAIVYKP
jgi:phospholipase/lecithinase/hemolysin